MILNDCPSLLKNTKLGLINSKEKISCLSFWRDFSAFSINLFSSYLPKFFNDSICLNNTES